MAPDPVPERIVITRRQAMALLGTAVGGLAYVRAQGGAVQFPRGAVIRTLVSDLPPERLAGGPTLFHEHLSLNTRPGSTFYSDVDLVVAEVKAAGADDSVKCLVDAGHADMGRKLDVLRRIARESGVAIVASGGYYLQRAYPPDFADRSVDDIAGQIVRDAAAERHGALGEIGQQGGTMTDTERKVFQAVARAQVRTGLPVFTHNPYTGTRQVAMPVPMDVGLRQLDVLLEAGASPASVAIGHVCCFDDVSGALPIAIARRGAYIGFDRVTTSPMVTDDQNARTVRAVIEAGHADKILLSSDFSFDEDLKAKGGAGFGQAAIGFGQRLRALGIDTATVRMITDDNPRRFLAFVPRA